MQIEIKNLTEIYVGTYYSEKSKGIYHFSFDEKSGSMTEPELFYEARNAKWVSLKGSSMALPIERQGRAGTCFLELRDGKTIFVGEILEEKETPCYILQKDDYIYTANYHEGNVMVYCMEGGKPSLVKRIENGTEAGCHQILLHEKYLMVPCLTQHRIRLFDTSLGFIPVGEIAFPDGSGPRHGVFNKAHTKLYVVSEWSNELFVFEVKGGKFILQQSLSILPDREKEKKIEASAAAIRLTKDERFLYISIRGEDILTVLKVVGNEAAVIQHISCGGAHPRDFVLSENEKFLLAANRFEGGIVSMERDIKSGLLKGIRHRVSMPEGVALALTKNPEEVTL